MPVPRTLLLIAPFIRYVGEYAVRARRGYLALVLTALAVGLALGAVRSGGSPSDGSGTLFLIGLLLVAAPLCGSWLEEDVHEGLAAWWLQKPVSGCSFYLARLVAYLIWSVIAALAVGLAAVPAALLGDAPLVDTLYRTVGLGWIPPLLVILAFLASGLGARNSALFAYGFLLAGFATPGLADAVWLGAAYGLLKLVFPPVWVALDLNQALAAGDLRQAVSDLIPLAYYTVASSMLGLLLALRVPIQLARSD